METFQCREPRAELFTEAVGKLLVVSGPCSADEWHDYNANRRRAGAVAGAYRTQIDQELVGALVPRFSILLQTPVHHVDQRRRNIRAQRFQWRRWLAPDGMDLTFAGFACKRAFARKHFVDDDADGPEVRACVRGFTARLLRTHIRDGSGGRARTRRIRIA